MELPQEAETIMISEIIMKLVKRYFPFIVTTAFFETFFWETRENDKLYKGFVDNLL